MSLGGIDGLRLEPVAKTRAGDLPIVRFDGRRPMNIVFHGHGQPFSYEFYGIHRGTEDRLTFIGPRSQRIVAHFLDCRLNSPSWGRRHVAELSADAGVVLVIPPGVAHTFDGLEDIYTINSFVNYLPEPNDWVDGKVEWNIAADTINLPRDAAEIPRVRCNSLAASEVFYEMTARNIAASLDGVVYEYPLVQRVDFDDQTSKILKIRRKEAVATSIPKLEPIEGIPGLAWRRRLFVIGGDGDASGYTIMNERAGFDVFDYGINPGVIESNAEWRAVTLLGPREDVVEIIVRDQMGAVVRLRCSPSPFVDLLLPPHTALTLEGTERVITINASCAVERESIAALAV